jgi:cyclopropane fatty-acyl-phospholipid synthase-like methyltransferase
MSESVSRSPIGPLEWTDETVASMWEYYSTQHPELYFTAQCGDRIISETMGDLAGARAVCDFGCGPGFLLPHLLKKMPAAGFDFSRDSLSVARKRVGGDPNLLGLHHVDEVDALNGAFDALYFVETIEHVLPHHLAGTFSLMHKLLKSKGTIVCTTPNEERLEDEMVYCPVTRKYFHRYQHIHSFSATTLTKLFREHGFDVVRTFTTNFGARGPIPRLKSRLKDRLGRKNPHLVLIAKKPV